MLTNRLEFHVVDMGAVLLGAAPFSLYNTAPVEQLLVNVDNAEPVVVIAEAQFADRARELVQLRPSIKLLVIEEDLETLEASGAGFDAVASARAVQPDDLLTLVYTSGTTGAPKGVQYVHKGLMYAVWAYVDRLQPVIPGRNVSYLPMAHIAERQIGYYTAFCVGMTINTLIDARRVQEAAARGPADVVLRRPADLREDRSGDARARPRRRDAGGAGRGDRARAQRRAVGRRSAAGAAARGDGAGARRLGRDLRRALLARDGRALPRRGHRAQRGVGDVRDRDRHRGRPGQDPDRRGRLALLGHRDQARRRRRDPAAQPVGHARLPEGPRAHGRGVRRDDGFIKTGDLARFDDDGYMWVVGRKKDIIINSAGKNMSPANIEQAIRGTDAVVAQVVCFGDGRSYNVGLIVIDPLQAAAVAGEDLPPDELARHPAVIAHVARVVEEGNARLSRVEQLKRYAIYEGAWTPGTDELTLTGKLKRADVNAKYAELVDDLYLTPAA